MRATAGSTWLSVIKEFFDAVGNATASPIDAYDAAAWSCIVPLSAESIRRGNSRVEIPDFTGGRVKVAPAAAGPWDGSLLTPNWRV